MKRRMTELCLLLCALLLMNGCGAANLFGSRGSSPRTLRFMHPDPEHQGVYEQLAQKYSKLHEGLTVKVLCAARDRYAADWLAAQKGDSPADLFAVLPGEGFAAFSESGILSKLKTDELLPEGYDKNLLQFGSDGKNTLAVPVTGSVPLIFYNAALYEKYGLIEPATISDFIVNCQLLKNGGSKPFAMAVKDGRWDMLDFSEGVIANGPRNSKLVSGGVLTDGKSGLDGEFYDLWGAAFSLVTSDALPEKSGAPSGHDQLIKQFAQGKYAMACGDSSDVSTLTQQMGAGKFGFFSMPGTDTAYGGVWKANLMLGISKKSKLKDDAEGFLSYLLSRDSQAALCDETSSVPAVQGVSLSARNASRLQKMLHSSGGYSLSVFQRIPDPERKVCVKYLDSFWSLQPYDIDGSISRFQQELEKSTGKK